MTKQIPSPEVEPWEKDIHQEVLPTLSLTSARQILLRAISWHLTHRTITACSNIAGLKLQDLPFMHMVSPSINPDMQEEISPQHSEHLHRLQNVLHSWNFEQVPMPGDGNCLFYATIFSIVERVQHNDTSLQQMVMDLGVPPSAMNVTDISTVLRKAVVSQLVGQNSSNYQGFET